MKWLSEKDITEFLQNKDFDVRKSNNARWIDQKCAADIITLVADCVIEYIEGDLKKTFWRGDIQLNKYTMENVKNIFKKPETDEPLAQSEYDKFFAQPLELLAYSGVLEKEKIKNKNYYKVKDLDILQFLALREKNALIFLNKYIEKVLKDSEIFDVFEDFFKLQNKNTYNDLKDAFKNFTIKNTPIKGAIECFRIFIKIINPLAYHRNIQGTEGGRLSRDKISYDMLMYNRVNFRDVYMNKPKGMTRIQYAEQMGISLNSTYTIYLSRKAKRILRLFNENYRNNRTEIYDERHINDLATNIHHIFPEADYPEICMYLENMIALTPTQHLNYAHPNGNTQIVDEAYQHICLIAKSGSIKENLENDDIETIYDFKNFVFVLYTGFEKDIFKKIDPMDFESLIREINLCYK